MSILRSDEYTEYDPRSAQIIDVVLRFYRTTRNHITRRSNYSQDVWPRMLCVHFVRRYTLLSQKATFAIIQRDRSCNSVYEKRIKGLIETDKQRLADYQTIESQIKEALNL